MYIKVSVRTNSKKEFVKQESENSYLVAVFAPAERGLANKSVLELLRNHLGQNVGMMKIVSGHHSPHKIIEFRTEESC